MGRRISVPVLLGMLTLCRVTCAGPNPAASPPTLSWLEVDGSPRFSLALEPQSDAAPVGALTAERWFAALPDLEVELLAGGRFPLGDARGSVLVVDFFATWCEPCREELPHFQALFEARRESGLVALAINVNEPVPLALRFAAEMGLTMPIGAYQTAMEPRLHGAALPTVVVADREGRIRGRWDGYKAGYEEEIAALVDRLLSDDPEPYETIAPVYRADVELRVRWLRRTSAPVEALIVSDGEDRPELIATLGRWLTVFESDGRTGKRRPLDRGLSRLTSADPARPWSAPLAGFRPGAETITVFESPGGRAENLEAAAPILDAAWFAAEAEVDAERKAGARLALATMDGLFVREKGSALRAVDGIGAASSLHPTVDDTGTARLAVLEIGGRIVWLDPSLRVVASRPAPGAWRIIGGDDSALGLGLAPSQVGAVVVGRFAGGREPWVALALDSELWLIDPRSGTIRFRAGWTGVQALATGDLDGDGVEELVVAGAGGELALLEVGPARDRGVGR